MRLKQNRQPETNYGLYHVNRTTGEKVPFDSPDRVGTKDAMESRARGIRNQDALGNPYPDEWTVQAFPEE